MDEGDCRALEKQYRGQDPPCQLDPEDGRFVMKGPKFNPMVVVNILAKERGYKIMYNPQQRSIPLKFILSQNMKSKNIIAASVNIRLEERNVWYITSDQNMMA